MTEREIKSQFLCQIYYEDTDLSGFVYHANYLKYFERAREHLIGITFLSRLLQQGIHFVVSQASLTYLSPSRHGDRLRIESCGRYSNSPAISFDQIAWLEGEERKCCDAKITIVALNHKNKPVRLPGMIIEHFNSEIAGHSMPESLS